MIKSSSEETLLTSDNRLTEISKYYDKLKKRLDARIKNDERLTAIYMKIAEGKADFKDTALYSEIVSNHLAEVLSNSIGELNTPLAKQFVCEELLKDQHSAVNEILGEVQVRVDSEYNIHIKPQKAPFPAERVRKIAKSLTDPTVPEKTIKRRAKAPVANVSKSFHDDYIRKNAAFRNDAGLDVYIVRMGTGCCKWCSEVSGKYKFGSQPDDIFRRHDNCDCTIIYDNQVLRGKLNDEGKRTRTWDHIGDVPDEYEPAVFTEEQAKELEQRNLSRFRGLTNSGDGGRINNRKCEIHLNKVQNFFLKPDAKHSKEFFDVGYTQNDIDKLTRDLEACFDYSKAVDKSVSETGVEKFSIFTELGVTKKKRFRTVWQKDTADSVPRIITAHREDG